MVEKTVQVRSIFRLTCYCCQSLVSHDWLLLFVLDALSDHVFIVLAANLTKNEADFVFEETGLRSIVFFGEEKT